MRPQCICSETAEKNMAAFELALIADCWAIERFSIECHKTRTKVITTANQNKAKYHKEPINCHQFVFVVCFFFFFFFFLSYWCLQGLQSYRYQVKPLVFETIKVKAGKRSKQRKTPLPFPRDPPSPHSHFSFPCSILY